MIIQTEVFCDFCQDGARKRENRLPFAAANPEQYRFLTSLHRQMQSIGFILASCGFAPTPGMNNLTTLLRNNLWHCRIRKTKLWFWKDLWRTKTETYSPKQCYATNPTGLKRSQLQSNNDTSRRKQIAWHPSCLTSIVPRRFCSRSVEIWISALFARSIVRNYIIFVFLNSDIL